jgi:hypothetical protein
LGEVCDLDGCDFLCTIFAKRENFFPKSVQMKSLTLRDWENSQTLFARLRVYARADFMRW